MSSKILVDIKLVKSLDFDDFLRKNERNRNVMGILRSIGLDCLPEEFNRGKSQIIKS
jgi:hypothetical protein